MANETNEGKKKKGTGERAEKPVKEKPAPYLINSESEKETALLEIQEMLGKIENDSELKSWEEELTDINKRAVELKAQISDRKKSSSTEKKDMADKIVLIKAGLAEYEVNKALGKTA
ncbi:hypothetical protein [Leptospira weilii]|uniref:hypothetical protein n=2 Tax=Leptospira weilii TaxID=28184 RepID=UPI0002BEB3A8|nr:hypothetical protein [Leptospira weilii]EMN44726.1 hypothetical protein LEP1GSC086_4233 [Leptospira weilii str. LNT 1234]QDK21575.1 hypothetical protein FHG67_01465 [Leptospira weilii]QDK24980.1 hypothetical protein FHG67_19915 [Leptospira weilii]QDK25540.1 hypothetical protein FHG68_01475 [Leptospira weilii]